MTRNLAAKVVRRLAPVLAGAVTAATAGGLQPADLGDLSLEELLDVRIARVEGASRHEQKVTRAPSSVTVVTADQIRRHGYRTLAQILAGIRGLYLSYDRNYTYLGMRGFLRPGDYDSRVLLLLDGHRMNDNIYDAAYVGREAMVPVEAIERVEFIRGPSSSVYGSNAFFGVINVVTRRGASIAGAQGWVEGGSRHTHEEGFLAGGRSRSGIELALAGSNYHSQGRRSLYFPEFGAAAHDADAELSRSLWARLDHGGWAVAAFASARDKEVPTASFGTVFDDGRESTRDRRFLLEARTDQPVGPARLRASVSYDRYEYAGDYPVASDGNVIVNRDESTGRWASAGLQLSVPTAAAHRFMAGVEYRANLAQDQLNYDAPFAGDYVLQDRRSGDVLGVYAQGELALAPRLTLDAGVRYDEYFGSFGGALNPRVGLIAAPSAATTLKLLYGQAFRAPNAYERFYFPDQAGAAPLQPETIRTYEAVIEHYLQRNAHAGVSVYHYSVRDLVAQAATPEGGIYFENRDRVRASGVELEAAAGAPGGPQVDASFALQRSEDGRSGRKLSNSPRRLARLRASSPVGWLGIDLAGELRYQGAVQTLAQATLPGFWLLDLHAQVRGLPAGVELSVSAVNLLDRRYAHPGAEDHVQDSLEQDGRSLRVRLGYRY